MPPAAVAGKTKPAAKNGTAAAKNGAAPARNGTAASEHVKRQLLTALRAVDAR